MTLRRAGMWTLAVATALAAAALAAAGVALLTAAGAPVVADDGVRARLASAAGGLERDSGVSEALEAVRAGRTKEAVGLLRDLEVDGPPELRARLANLLGVLVLMSGNGARTQAEARRHFERALGTDPALEDAKFNLELLLSQESRRGRQPPSGGQRARSAVRQGGAGKSGAGY